jgi:hypothetical protein
MYTNDDIEISCNEIYGNGVWGDIVGYGNGIGVDAPSDFGWDYSSTNVDIHNNDIYGNTGYGLRNYQTISVLAENNWWGAADGPSGAGPGSGDEVSSFVDYDPWSLVENPCTPLPVPEPSTAVMFILGGLLGFRVFVKR